MTLKDLNIDKSWTLFLDRDGVINKKIENDYVKHWIDFEFLEDSFPALKKIAAVFGHIVVVTNQQGIGKGLYRTEDLEIIHRNMLYEITYHGGRIDKVFFSPYLHEQNHPTRKPGTGMALQAKKEFPSIDFTKSIIVGDSMSDMQFGRNAGLYTAYISAEKKNDPLIDFNFTSLKAFSDALPV
jgi:D-glycero-D-manno-heptose 1,7-bisphosphate phosphatase